MKASRWLPGTFALLTCIFAGCVADNAMRLSVSGTPGAAFTAHYRVGAMQGEVSSDIKADSSEVLEVSGKGIRPRSSESGPKHDPIPSSPPFQRWLEPGNDNADHAEFINSFKLTGI
jgi:hypothetical protein